MICAPVQPLMFKGLEKGWNELTAQIERDRKHLQEVFQPVRAEKQSEPRIEAAE